MENSTIAERRRLQASDEPSQRDYAFGRPEMAEDVSQTLDDVARRNARFICIPAVAQGASELPGGHPSTRRRKFCIS
jgi:hypothetical protein